MTSDDFRPTLSNAIYGLLTSPKKRIDEFVLFAFFTLHGKQIKFFHSFFGRIYGAPICLLVLSQLSHVCSIDSVLETCPFL